MLKLPTVSQYSVVAKHINDRLVRIMEDCIKDGIIIGEEPDQPDGNRITRMLPNLYTDKEFLQYIHSMYLPETYPVDRAGIAFLGLYKLLKVDTEYVPELPMEYILYCLIHDEMDKISDFGEEADYISRLPEPARSDLKKSIAVGMEGDDEDEAEFILSMYEDLREYDEICFWDHDFLLLEHMSMEEIKKSDINKEMGILPEQEAGTVEFDCDIGKGKKTKVSLKVPPWELEYEQKFNK